MTEPRDHAPRIIPGLALITIVHGRERHLARQLAAIDSAEAVPELHIIVAMDDPAVAPRYADRPRTRVIECPSTGAHLPLAGARNTGAAAARERGADVLVFLDVDCLPDPDLFSRYDDAVRAHPGELVCGAVGYLPEGTDYGRPDLFADAARFHGFRPRFDASATAPGDHLAFWSLSFATTPDTWLRIGGFFEGYSGYGGEDTDFAVTAGEAGVPSAGWAVPRRSANTTRPPTRPCSTSTTSCATARSSPNAGVSGPCRDGSTSSSSGGSCAATPLQATTKGCFCPDSRRWHEQVLQQA